MDIGGSQDIRMGIDKTVEEIAEGTAEGTCVGDAWLNPPIRPSCSRSPAQPHTTPFRHSYSRNGVETAERQKLNLCSVNSHLAGEAAKMLSIRFAKVAKEGIQGNLFIDQVNRAGQAGPGRAGASFVDPNATP